MHNIVFLFSKMEKVCWNKITVQITEKVGKSRHVLEDILLSPFHTRFAGFDMVNAALMRHVNQCIPSERMRVFMHATIVAAHMPEGYSISCTNIGRIRNSILILHKSHCNQRRLLRQLKRNGNILLVDVVERVPEQDSIPYYDGIICCSRKGYRYFSEECPHTRNIPIYFIAHCADQRIGTVTTPQDRLATSYFGLPKNLFMVDSARSLVTIVPTNAMPGHDWISRLSEANFHYAVRPPVREENEYKPFTKGFIAATCNANILVHKDDGDAAHYLGEDYPYLIKEDLSEEVVLRYLRKAQAEFGGEVWRFGLEKMAQLREVCANTTIATQFWAMIEDAKKLTAS